MVHPALRASRATARRERKRRGGAPTTCRWRVGSWLLSRNRAAQPSLVLAFAPPDYGWPQHPVRTVLNGTAHADTVWPSSTPAARSSRGAFPQTVSLPWLAAPTCAPWLPRPQARPPLPP